MSAFKFRVFSLLFLAICIWYCVDCVDCLGAELDRLPAEAQNVEMNFWQAALLGIIEGVTEYLPISSTGHLVVAQRIMGIGIGDETSKNAANAFAICIQGGAILAVLGIYWRHCRRMFMGFLGKDAQGLHLALLLLVAFLPAAVLGLALNDLIKEHLFGIKPITQAWVVGGVVILFFVLAQKRGYGSRGKGIFELGFGAAFLVGFIQCLAMWPGVSRSLAVILGGILVGLSLVSAVEFSFLLGVITLGAATAMDAFEHGALMLEVYGWAKLALGFLLAFVSAAAAVKWMIAYLNRHSLAVFGWYRIILGLVVAWFFL